MVIKKLASQTFVYGLSTVIPKVINYLLAPYLTYIALGSSDFGVMSYFYAIIPFVFALLLIGMESAFFRFIGKADSDGEKREIFNTIWTTSLLLSTIFISLVLIFNKHIYSSIGDNFHPSIIILVALIIVIDVASAMPFANLREQERALKFSLIKTLSVIVNIIFVIFFYSILPLVKEDATFSWMWIDNFGCGYVFVANLIASTVTLIITLTTLKRVRLSINFKVLKGILMFSIPLFIGGLAGTANELLDRFFIEGLLPEDVRWSELGVYSATLKITAVMIIFTQMYRYAAEPLFLARLKKEDFKAGNADAMTFFVIVSTIIFLGVILYIDIFKFLIAPEYRVGISLVPKLLLSGALMGIFLNLNFWYKYVEKTHFAIIITGAGLIISIGLNLWLIPILGLDGAATAKLSATFFMVILSYYFNQKYYPIPYKIRRIAEYIIYAALLFIIAKYMNIESVWLNYSLRTVMLLSFIFYAIKRENILLLLNKKV